MYNRRGDTALAERTLRDAVRRLRTTHEQGFLAEAERQLAEVLVKQGKFAEAERLVDEAQRRVGREDAWTPGREPRSFTRSASYERLRAEPTKRKGPSRTHWP